MKQYQSLLSKLVGLFVAGDPGALLKAQGLSAKTPAWQEYRREELHVPHRLPGESREAYHERQRASKVAAKATFPAQDVAPDPLTAYSVFLGQRRNPEKNKVRKAKRSFGSNRQFRKTIRFARMAETMGACG